MAYQFNRYDQTKIEDGEWVEIDGGDFKIAKFGNPHHMEVGERIDKELKRKHGGKEIPLSARMDATAREFAEGILRDWKDMMALDENKNPVSVPYSIEAATELLRNDEPLLKRIRIEANDLTRFENERLEEQAKKPRSSSAGSTTGKSRAKTSTQPSESTSE